MKLDMNLSAKNNYLIILMSVIGLVSIGCASQQQQERENENLIARARAHTDLGSVYLQQRKFEISLEEFTLAAKIDPSFASAFNGLGLVNAALGKDDVADANFRNLYSLNL